MELRGIEPRAFHMQSERSTTELQPLLFPTQFIIYLLLEVNIGKTSLEYHISLILRLIND